MLSPQAKFNEGGWNDGYLQLCMEADGFVIDSELKWGGANCGSLPYPQIVASCYRRDDWLSQLLSHFRYGADSN
jgi:hypothetical protein